MNGIYKSEAGARLIAQRCREFLKFWPQPTREIRVATRYGETFVVSCGRDAAPALLLLHGSGSNSAMWIRDAAVWAQKFKVHAVDLIGEAGLSAESRPPMNSDAYALWLDDVLKALALDRFAMIGISLGGWLAVDYATRHPARVDRLVLMVPGGIGRQRLSFVFKILPLLLLGDWGRKKAMHLVIGPRASGPSGQQLYVDFMLLVQRHFRPRMQRLPLFSDEALRQLKMPVFAILGAKDAILDSAHTQQRLARHVPHAQIAYLAGVGHGIFGQNAAILDFLSPPPMQ
jgi:pimeloyl-ACP methyl ester carboxylesterase